MRCNYALALGGADRPTLDDLREAATTLEDLVPTARRVLGGSHPAVVKMEGFLRDARAELHAREASTGSA